MPDQFLVVPGSIDTHCHTAHIRQRTELGESTGKVDALLREFHADGLAAIVDVGISPDDLPDRSRELSDMPWILLSSGLHPTQANRNDRDALLAQLAQQAAHAGIVAVGEIGLDYHWDAVDHAAAIELFDSQVRLAVRHDLPVIVHNREADEDVCAVLTAHRPRGVMHCFSQTAEFCRKCLDLGLFISFGGNLTFKGSESIRQAARIVPDDRLLVETDAPYLSPVPVRGHPNHPGHLGFTIEALAILRQTAAESLALKTAQNARTLFGLSS